MTKIIVLALAPFLAISTVSEAHSSTNRQVISGIISRAHADDFDSGKASLKTTLLSSQDRLVISAAESRRLGHIAPGSRVVVSATRKGYTLRHLRLIKASAPQTISPAAFSGTRKVLAIVGSGRDPAAVTTALFSTSASSAKRMFEWQSNGKQTITGDVTSQTFPTLPGVGCPYNEAGAQLKAAAQTAGYKLDSYDHIIYVLPPDFSSKCPWGGLGEIGDVNNQAKGLQVWLTSIEPQAIAHELSHNFGLDHAHSIDCDRYLSEGSYSWSPFPPVKVGTRSCTVSEYGDMNDYMGNRATSLSPRNLQLIGARSSDSTLIVKAPGIYSLGDSFSWSTSVREIRIPWDVEPGGRAIGYLSIEARRSWLAGLMGVFDIGSCNAACAQTRMNNGVLARLVKVSGGIGKIVDIPGSDALTYHSSADGYASAASQIWQSGSTIKDSERGLQVRVISASPTGASIAVDQVPDTRDSQAPSRPDDIAAFQLDNDTRKVNVTWRNSTDNFEVVGYRVIANGAQVAEVKASPYPNPTPELATVPFRPVAGKATYSVRAFDAAGNISEPSAEAVVIDNIPKVSRLRWQKNRKKKSVTTTFTRSIGTFKLVARRGGKMRSSNCKYKGAATKCTIRLAKGKWLLTLTGSQGGYPPFKTSRSFKF